MICVLFWEDKLVLLVQYLVRYYGAKTYQNFRGGVKSLQFISYYPLIYTFSLSQEVLNHVQFLTIHQTTADTKPCSLMYF